MILVEIGKFCTYWWLAEEMGCAFIVQPLETVMRGLCGHTQAQPQSPSEVRHICRIKWIYLFEISQALFNLTHHT
jgi:hypothetical protein